MQRYFRIEEARRLLDRIEPVVREMTSLKTSYDEAEGEFRASTQRIALSGGAHVDRDKILAQRKRRDAIAARLKESLEAVQEFGCVVKDLDLGLIDFPTMFRGQEANLCWKLGEATIEFWHGPHEGFRGRKPIDRDFLDNHRGEEPGLAG